MEFSIMKMTKVQGVDNLEEILMFWEMKNSIYFLLSGLADIGGLAFYGISDEEKLRLIKNQASGILEMLDKKQYLKEQIFNQKQV